MLLIEPTDANIGIELKYERMLTSIARELDRDVTRQVVSQYASHAPAIAQDESPASAMGRLFKRITRSWVTKLDQVAPEFAKWMATETKEATDAAFLAGLRKAGFVIKWKFTPQMRDVVDATIEQNVGLIKSIGSQYLDDAQGLVMRSIAAGRDLGQLTGDLQKRYEITERRAALIARHQNNLATEAMNRARMLESGITQAVWRHSKGGNHPRPSHVAADGKVFDLQTGCLIDGELIFPKQLIWCRCGMQAVIPGLPPRPLKRLAEAV